jgi:hypothetical protein
VTPPRSAWGNAVLLLPAGAICAFGLGALALSVALEPEVSGGVPPLPEPPRSVAPTPTSPEGVARIWPALFGLPPVPAPPPEPDEPADEVTPMAEPAPPLTARLRGLALDEDGGWALIDLDGQVVLVRPGSPLSDHHTVSDIRQDGVLILGPEGPEMLSFDAADPVESPPTGSVRESLARAYLRGAQDLFDMPMPLPPAGYIPGPGFMGPIDR